LSDFTSVKEEPVRVMLETRACVIGCHPVFGPMVDPRGQNVVLCPARPGPFLDWYRAWFESHGMHVEEMEASAHDRAMGMIQGLAHFVNIAFARTLRSSGSSADDLLKVSSPVYRIFFATLSRILSGDPGLYGAIQTLNPWSRQAVKAFLKNGGEILAAIERGDQEAFVEMFQEAARYLGEAGQEARAESDRMIGHPRRSSSPPGKS
jgi:prephenate dehydrogenase